ncbi:hypothetical protein J7T55_011042 [Diaporthe amygdali]|uniref:uncharacterized protein n=1 Tax=Phomopsis amygdali TaxID=1214568 RepID=UPI0022FE6762|nr:uncharacterized protein J7T55_011042 [Diaporthe amygdali]KAJ0106947.1 hypothetical protein J7T55_011042 [Diaporthe amygdali]
MTDPPQSVGTRRFDTNTLRKQIQDKLVNSIFPTFETPYKKFLPEGTLKTLFTPGAVKKELGNHYDETTYDFIRDKASKVFAVLILTDKPEAILAFKKFEVHDDYLPIALKNVHSPEESDWQLCSERDREPSQCDVMLGNLLKYDCEWSSSPYCIEQFCEQQWQFMAPVFSDNSGHHRFSSNTILPFYSPEKRPAAEKASQKPSTFSTVYESWVHPDHQAFSNQEHAKGKSVAVKKMNLDVLIVETYKVDQAYRSEIEALELFRKIDSPHLIKFLCTFEHGDQGYYMMFPWATANLREYLEVNHPDDTQGKDPTPKAYRVKWVLNQLAGLSEAIWKLHNPSAHQNPALLAVPDPKQANCRHGDLKPDNILLMGGPDDGRLVIADVGLTKVHDLPTRYRKDHTRSMTGTAKYEPPDILRGGPRSRAYDIWSFGCICVEFIIWTLYGPSGLKVFHERLGSGSKFWFTEFEDQVRKAVKEHNENSGPHVKWSDTLIRSANQALKSCRVTQYIQVLLNEMKGSDPRCSGDSPINDLLSLTENRLLKIEINLGSGTIDPRRHRADAREMSEGICKIRDRADKEDSYLAACLRSSPMPEVPHWDSPPQMPSIPGSFLGADLPSRPIREHASPAEGVINSPTNDIFFPAKTQEGASVPCYSGHEIARKPREHDLLTRGSGYGTQALDDTWSFTGDNKFAQALFRKITPSTAWKARAKYNSIALDPHSVSAGIKSLFSQSLGTQTLFPLHLLLCNWDYLYFRKQRVIQKSGELPLPTRILDVGDPGKQDASSVKLVKALTVENETKYVALSHRWGPMPFMRPTYMCTTQGNISSLMLGFDARLLPQTFQDAIHITKVIGVRYLWIDSLCIIQDSFEDWHHESSLMEGVFANAYCTIAATRAMSSVEGFLQPRPDRQCEALRPVNGSPYYVCDQIDDFRGDVENSTLNQRGWVLQERALSHRTIYFAESQIYWECGYGVHCETLTKLNNLYEQYSTLSFTFVEDRHVAILGVERRLLQSLGTTGAYGVLEAYLHRTLLWQRAKGQDRMRRLSDRLGRKVPTWSWMAYDGTISYMRVPYGEVTWNDELSSPFRGRKVGTDGLDVHELELVVVGRKLVTSNTSLMMRKQIVFDDNILGVDQLDSLAVVIGEEKCVGIIPSQRMYVILVSPWNRDNVGINYQRIGAGFLLKGDMANDGLREIRII